MTIKELAAELSILVESGYGNAKAVFGIPTVYVTEDGDISINDYRHETGNIIFSAKDYIKGSPDTRLTEIPLHDASYDTCSCWDYYDDREECEGEDDEECDDEERDDEF